MAYRLELPEELARVHDVFHVSQLKEYHHDPARVLQPEVIELNEDLTYEERPVKILDTKERTTRNKSIEMVKVQWSNHNEDDATWELKSDVETKYPELFKQR